MKMHRSPGPDWLKFGSQTFKVTVQINYILFIFVQYNILTCCTQKEKTIAHLVIFLQLEMFLGAEFSMLYILVHHFSSRGTPEEALSFCLYIPSLHQTRGYICVINPASFKCMHHLVPEILGSKVRYPHVPKTPFLIMCCKRGFGQKN